MRQSAIYKGWAPSRRRKPELPGGEGYNLTVFPGGSRAMRLGSPMRLRIFSAGACPCFHPDYADLQPRHKTYTVSSSIPNLRR
jgi:hypothetical protein